MTEFEWEESGVPARYRGLMLDDCPAEAADKVRKFCTGNGTDVLVITGGNGTAKTAVASASFTERDVNGLEVGLYLSCKYQLCPMFRSSRLTSFGMSEYDLYRKYYETPYLVMDEYGKGDDERLEKAVVRNILSARYDRGLLTALVTNFTMKEITGDSDVGLGNDIASRLRETATVFVMDGADWRADNRGMPHVGQSRRPERKIRCIICGGEMTDAGTCSNPKCAAYCGDLKGGGN